MEWLSGKTMELIAREQDVSTARAHQIIKEARKKLDRMGIDIGIGKHKVGAMLARYWPEPNSPEEFYQELKQEQQRKRWGSKRLPLDNPMSEFDD